MANKLPAYILKDCTLVLDGNQRIGQCRSITVPVMEKTVETFRNAGMIKPREVMMGYEVTTCTFTETAFDPDVMALFGVTRGKNKRIIAYGYLENEDGSEHETRFEMVCEIKKTDPQSWSPGEKAESEYAVAVHEGRLMVNDREIYAFDDFEVKVDGVTQQPGRRSALRLA